MLGFQKYLYTVVAEIDGWTIEKTFESDVTLPKNEVARRGFDLFGLNAKLIGYKMKTI
ncbi:hypothetical protein [Gracilibacillus lacisalsi]|uniref:hypothetical protein n=1 Tax=Gracilibacillus lacisalsi TaxID=393087 RepID=UPI00037A2C6F|nr:hypothetical protein [Gracilibacillus lacisalsi]